MIKKVTSRNTKSEILEALKELESTYKELESKKVLTSPAKAATTPIPKVSKKETKETVVQPKNAHATMEEMIQALESLGEKFNTALSQLSTNLLVEASHLKEVRTDVDDESNRLASLYDLKIEENTLSDLLKQYSYTAEQLEETLKQKREELEKTWFEKNQASDTEKEEKERALQEQETAVNKTQKRDESEYKYDLTQKRELNNEEYTQQQRQQQQALNEIEEARRQVWDEHEKTLVKREKQFEEDKTKVERFPKELETAIKKAKEEGTGIARHQAKIKVDLVAKEFSGDEEVYQLKILSLEEQVATQAVQIDKLSKQLEAALQQAQVLAVKAIEGTSSHSSFEALKEIALEQAKNPSKTK